ncbi:MAG TPA: CatB-related O-acetyltransferase [Holophaga sp.]|nr:CatB-related O-acetyltransferase [Holophaga sp.]
MRFQYFEEERRDHWKKILLGLLPPGALLLRRWLRYRRRYPRASVDPASLIETGARLEEGCVIHAATLGATVEVGACSTVGAGSVLSGMGPIRIGRFCSIGPDCFIRSDNHDHGAVTTYPLGQLADGVSAVAGSFRGGEIQLGHDVWLGRGVTILAGAHLGTGSIVAAGCVVPGKAFPPYSIIGGVPGKVLRMRFPEATVASLLAEAWWDRPLPEILGPMRERLLRPPDPELPTASSCGDNQDSRSNEAR